MKPFIKLLILLCVGSSALAGGKVCASAGVESKEIDLQVSPKRPLRVKLWYGSEGADCGRAICLSKTQVQDKVAVVSHGAFGSPRSMNWLGYGLAAQGWVVVGLAHYGESWIYGRETIDPASASLYSQRAADFSLALDRLSEANIFSAPLQFNKVLGLGHSAGGFTALAMLGVQFEPLEAFKYCTAEFNQIDRSCFYQRHIKEGEMDEAHLARIQSQSTEKDVRVVSVVALDPALGHGVSKRSLESIKQPVLVVGSKNNDFLPYKVHGDKYASNIRAAKSYFLDGQEGHFVYIDECKLDIKAAGLSICQDRPGVSRRAAQQKVMHQISRFIKEVGIWKLAG